MAGKGWISLEIFLYMVTIESTFGDYSIRATNYGKVKGKVEYVHGHKEVEQFFGIPYASPPVGKLRLEAPEPPQSWGNKILDATELPAACPQTTEGVAYVEYHVPGFNKTSEDCLYLNIYVPRGRHVSRSMPVLVFVHGGSYLNGMGAMFDGSALSSHGIVVVTFNYRLGPLGFMTSVDDVIPGNYGMLDMVQALKWVQQNIDHFNGDPGRVTIDGHSAGGCSVGLLLLSPLAKGLYHQVIQQSGSPLAQWSVTRHQTKPNFIYNVFARVVNCHGNSSIEVKRCMQSLDSRTLENVILEQFEVKDQFEWSVSLTPQYRPVVDGHFLPKAPEELVKTAHLNAQRFMTGATKDEGLVAAIPLVKLFGVGKTGVKRLLSLMSCFRGDLPEVTGIVEKIIRVSNRLDPDEEPSYSAPYLDPNCLQRVLAKYIELKGSDISESEIESSFSEIVGDYFITAPTHLMAEELSKRNVSVYVYNYEYRSLLDQWKGTIHGAELFYLSGCPFSGHKNFRYDEPDKDMAKLLILLWSNFIKYGTPSLYPREEMALPRYTPDRKLYTRIYSRLEPTISIGSDYKPAKMSFWNRDVPIMYRRAINVSYPTDVLKKRYFDYRPDKKTWILTSVCLCLSVLTLVLTVAYYRMRRDMARIARQNGMSNGERMLPAIL